MTLRDKIVRAILSPVHAATVWSIGLYTLLWGIWVVNPYWNVFSAAQLFSALGLVAPEVFWGSFAILCSAVIIWGGWRKSRRSLQIGASTAWFHWMMIAFFYFVGDWHNTGGITSLAIALYSGYVWLNIRVNSKYKGKTDRELML